MKLLFLASETFTEVMKVIYFIFWPYNFLNEETNVVDRNRNELKLNKKIPVSLLQVWVPLFYIHSFQIPLAQSYSQK